MFQFLFLLLSEMFLTKFFSIKSIIHNVFLTRKLRYGRLAIGCRPVAVLIVRHAIFAAENAVDNELQESCWLRYDYN